MSKSINRVTLIGHLGAEPEVKYLPSGGAVANATAATNEKWKDRQTGEARESTEWHRLVFFGRIAEILGEFAHKGSRIYVEGRLQTRKWEDKQGVEKYTTEIIVNNMVLLDAHGATENEGGNEQRAPKPPKQPSPQADEDLDDDIPF